MGRLGSSAQAAAEHDAIDGVRQACLLVSELAQTVDGLYDRLEP